MQDELTTETISSEYQKSARQAIKTQNDQ